VLFVGAFTAIAFANPSLAVTGYLAVVAFYVLPTPARVALLKRLRSEPSIFK
jgi:hypothetical protein